MPRYIEFQSNVLSSISFISLIVHSRDASLLYATLGEIEYDLFDSVIYLSLLCEHEREREIYYLMH